MALTHVAKTSDIPEGKMLQVQVGENQVNICNVGGKFHAVGDVCPHSGGPLSEGELEDCVVTCPWHGKQFDVTTGRGVSDAGLDVSVYPLEVRDGDIFVDV